MQFKIFIYQCMKDLSDKKMKAILLPNTNKKTIQNIKRSHVKPSSIIITDEHKSYKGLDKLGHNHKSINHSRRKYVRGKIIHTNGIESIWTLAKRKYKTVHYWFSYKHAQKYLDALAYKVNFWKKGIHAIEMIQCFMLTTASGSPCPYETLVA